MQLDTAWREYYMETEPEVRKALLSKLLSEHPEDESGAIRERLFRLRHEDASGSGKAVDKMLWQCVNFAQMYGLFFMRRAQAVREIEESLRGVGLWEALAAGPAGEKAFYQEARNGVKRYLHTCELAGYRRKLFGLMGAGPQDRKEQIAKDVWRMSEGLAGKFGMEEEMRLWTRAVIDAYLAAYPSDSACLEAVRTQAARKKS